MKLIPNAKKMPKGQRIVYRSGLRYYGWTGYEHFGVITCYRYFGWEVTCWADVRASVYPLNQHVYFARLEDAIIVLDRFMDRAKKMRRLSNKPVKYWTPPKNWKQPQIWRLSHLEPIAHPYFRSNPRAPFPYPLCPPPELYL